MLGESLGVSPSRTRGARGLLGLGDWSARKLQGHPALCPSSVQGSEDGTASFSLTDENRRPRAVPPLQAKAPLP